jgi:hypothetical protein
MPPKRAATINLTPLRAWRIREPDPSRDYRAAIEASGSAKTHRPFADSTVLAIRPIGAGSSDREALATLGATGTDHSLPPARLLANQEAVGSLATANGWLVSAFHD